MVGIHQVASTLKPAMFLYSYNKDVVEIYPVITMYFSVGVAFEGATSILNFKMIQLRLGDSGMDFNYLVKALYNGNKIKRSHFKIIVKQ